jgi:WD40-like Beta Propeller Repeat
MNRLRFRRLGRQLSLSVSVPLVAALALGACSSPRLSNFSSGSAGSGVAASGGTGPGGGGGTPSNSGGIGTIVTIGPAGGDDGGIDYDASLAPPVEAVTKVPGKMYADFPAAPILDTMAPPPTNAATLFGPAGQGAATGGPCLFEPEPNALYPRNWMRPRFRWTAAGGQNLFEVRVHVANQANDLVSYTAASSWTMTDTIWAALHEDSYDEPMTITVRGGVLAGNALTGVAASSSTSASIAPVEAPGSIVYWTTTNGTALKGFRIGDETVEPVLLPAQVVQPAGTTCVGCHTATPDGEYASFSIQPGPWPNALANIQPGLEGQAYPLGAGAAAFLASSAFGINTFSRGHWAAGDHVEISMYQNQNAELVWIDLDGAQMATSWGKIALTGDPNGGGAGSAGAPSWSHDGNTIAYVSLVQSQDGRLNNGPAAIYTVPYNNRQGGTATAVMGANDPAANQYYPAFSPDDQYIVFSKTTGAAAQASMYNNVDAEIDVVPTGGGTATRLVANDPAACTTQRSPGVTNSWPKSAPEVGTATDGRVFYWVIFSSTRDPLAMRPQLYVTPIVVSGKTVTTYSSLYLWNQPEAEANHTPAWENFRIPIIPHIGPR